jgi:hypothetical protein
MGNEKPFSFSRISLSRMEIEVFVTAFKRAATLSYFE